MTSVSLDRISAWRRRLIIGLVSILCLFAVMVVFLPVVIQVGAQSWLSDQGIEPSIDFVGFDLYSGTLTIENAKGVNANGKGFSLRKLLVEINWKPLFENKLDVQRIEVVDFYVDAVSGKEKLLTIAGIKLPAKNKAEPKEVKPEQDNEPSPWAAQLQQVTLENIKICHSQDVEQKQASVLTVEDMMASCLSLAGMKWIGNIGWHAPDKGQPVDAGINIVGDFSLKKLLLARSDAEQVFTELGELSITGLDIKALKQITVETIALDDVKLLQHRIVEKEAVPYLASWKNLTLTSALVDLEQSQASLADVTLNELSVFVDRDKKGLAGLPLLSEEKPTLKSKKPTVKSTPFNFKIENITVKGKSYASIIDRTVDPVFKESLSDINVKLSQIYSAKPNYKSPLSALLKIGEYGQLDLKGTAQPFAKRVSIDLQQDIKNIDLANLNVYGKTFIGHRIKSGHLNLKQKLVIRKGILDTESKFVFQKFQIESLEGKEAEKYKSDLGIPLSLALSLLRDKDDSIHLTIPVTGDVNSPDFSINDILATVTSKAIKEAIINYYTPFGLVALVGGVFDLAAGLSFDPVVFPAGKTVLDEQAMGKLTKMSTLLSERPQVHLTLCGNPVRSDILAKYKLAELGLKKGEEQKPFKLNEKQKNELLALVKTRTDSIKKHMVNQFKVNPGQLIVCSEPDNKDWLLGIEAKPEIAISL